MIYLPAYMVEEKWLQVPVSVLENQDECYAYRRSRQCLSVEQYTTLCPFVSEVYQEYVA